MERSLRQPLELNEFLPYRLSVLANKVSRALARLYTEEFGLTIPEWRIMAVLGQAPGLCADEVAARTQMDKVTVSRAVTRLVGKGHVNRSVSETDRRRSDLRLSRDGYGIYAQIIPLAHDLERKLLGALPSGDRSRLFALLESLDSGVEALLETAD